MRRHSSGAARTERGQAARPRGGPVTPSPSSTQPTTTSSAASTSTPLPPRSGTSRCSLGCGPTNRTSTYPSPTPSHAGSRPTGPGSEWTAVVAESRANVAPGR